MKYLTLFLLLCSHFFLDCSASNIQPTTRYVPAGENKRVDTPEFFSAQDKLHFEPLPYEQQRDTSKFLPLFESVNEKKKPEEEYSRIDARLHQILQEKDHGCVIYQPTETVDYLKTKVEIRGQNISLINIFVEWKDEQNKKEKNCTRVIATKFLALIETLKSLNQEQLRALNIIYNFKLSARSFYSKEKLFYSKEEFNEILNREVIGNNPLTGNSSFYPGGWSDFYIYARELEGLGLVVHEHISYSYFENKIKRKKEYFMSEKMKRIIKYFSCSHLGLENFDFKVQKVEIDFDKINSGKCPYYIVVSKG